MKKSIGYTATLNIMIVFITIIITFLCAALIYFKSNKVSNMITSSIEKYEDFDINTKNEIARNLTSIGYGSRSIVCEDTVEDRGAYNGVCSLIKDGTEGTMGYCVYICYEEDNFDGTVYRGDYYYYRIRTNMMINIPIIHDLLNVPIYSNTIRLYNFRNKVN